MKNVSFQISDMYMLNDSIQQSSNTHSLMKSMDLNTSKKLLNKPSKMHKYYSKVTPTLLIEWQGQNDQNGMINGKGILRVTERSIDITKKGNLIFSLYCNNWQKNKPTGNIKMTSIQYYEQKGPNNIVKEVRKYEGGCQSMAKHGYGQYTIQKYYANQTTDISIVKGQWFNDFLTQTSISQNNQNFTAKNMVQNIQMQNQRLMMTKKTLQPIQNTSKQINNSSNQFPQVALKKKRSSNFLEVPAKHRNK